MRRVLLFYIALISSFTYSQTLTLDSLYVSDVGSSEMVEVTVVTSKAVEYTYIGSSYTTNSNQINLEVCYYFPIFAPAVETTLTHKLYVYLPVGFNDYMLKLNLYNSQSATSCDYFENLDSANLNFIFPLTDTVFLSNLTIKPDFKVEVYPNPVKNSLNINANANAIESISLYNVLGEKVLESRSPSSPKFNRCSKWNLFFNGKNQ